MQELISRAAELMREGRVQRVLGWKRGELGYDVEPAFFETEESLSQLVYDGFCGANLSKYMISASKLDGVTLVFLKPCDTYSMNRLIAEHRVLRDKMHIIGVGCCGKLDTERVKAQGVRGILSAEVTRDSAVVHTRKGDVTLPSQQVLLERCRVCKGKEHMIADEIIGESCDTVSDERFREVQRIENMSPGERFEFFRSELSKCIRCNACRNVCPACSCRKCVFDGTQFDSAQKANATSFEENMFHVIRAFHVAGRCTDCGECSRVCPQGIPLHLLNRKLIKDINTLYGEYVPGAEASEETPLTSFSKTDAEPHSI